VGPLSSSIDLLATLSVVIDVVVVVVAVGVANAASFSNASLTAFLFKARLVLSEGLSKRSIRSDVRRRFASYGERARQILHQNVTVTAVTLGKLATL